jgi:hypothetical protein
MSFEESPSLDEYKAGLPENLPDPSIKKRRVRLLLGILFGISLFLGIANFLQSKTASLLLGTGSVQGTVVDAQGSPFLGDVFVIGVDQIVSTSPDGSFLLERIPSGDQSLVVANATTGQEHPVRVVAGQTLNVGQLQFLVTATPGK